MAASVAHELNSPLTSILGYAELLLESPNLDEMCRDDLQVIASEGRRTHAIVRDLLDFSRQRKPQKKIADINQILQQTLALVCRHLEKSQVTIEEAYDADIPPL